MRKRIKIVLIVATGLLLIGGVVAWQWDSIRRAYWMHSVHAATSSLPHCDRVEVFYLAGDPDPDAKTEFPVRPYNAYSRILGRKTVSGSDAEALATLWRAQVFGHDYQALCHEPAYGFRFFRGSTLKFETSVCFHCSNFYVTALGGSSWWGFDSRASQAEQLLKRLQEIFPESIPKPKTK